MSRLSSSAPLLGISTLTGIGALLVLYGYRSLLPWVGSQDNDVLAPKDLVDLTLKSVQYVQNLAMATFGGTALLLSQRFLGRGRARDDRPRRIIAAMGLVCLALSMLAGFVAIESIIEAAEHGVVRVKTDPLRDLRLLQSGFLICGVLLVGGAILADLLRGKGEMEI